MQGILIALAVIAMLAGAIFYNPLRRKMNGVVGVGGSYMILIGIMILVMSIALLFSGGEVGASSAEVVVMLIFMVICLGYTAYVMIARCHTALQRILLPFAACLIGLGFCWRFLAAIVFHIPMESGKTNTVHFPETITDDQLATWQRQGDGTGDREEYYCAKTGGRITLDYTGGYVNYPAGWRPN